MSIKLRISSWPHRAAIHNGVLLLKSSSLLHLFLMWSRSHLKRYLTRSRCPYRTAWCSGVSLLAIQRTSRFAPRDISSFAVESRPCRAAQWSGVQLVVVSEHLACAPKVYNPGVRSLLRKRLVSASRPTSRVLRFEEIINRSSAGNKRRGNGCGIIFGLGDREDSILVMLISIRDRSGDHKL